MGKFKELAIEVHNNNVGKTKKEIVNDLVIRYPFIADFVKEAFKRDEENKVYELIFALETAAPC